ncbi:MAG: YkgJ family cysteine cluster protein [Yoonia sp.]|uniref:YkgJ family cysteine cluster protein n=1 Tax=Yoonia sp. TaxID=2212373 RepID=UPI003EF4D0AE
MKPTSPRAARRLSQKAASGGPLTLQALSERVAKAKVKTLSTQSQDRAKRILQSYLQTAQAHGMPVKDAVAEMQSGKAAQRLGDAVRQEILKTPPDAVRNAACADGCAFCCILPGGDGGLITQSEAETLHTAVLPFAGQPDGRAWHPNACPALDPVTRSCRAYDARPTICRSFLSTDAEACRENAEGGTEGGAGLLGSHLDYLAVHALCRQVLKGIAQVHSYSLAAVAAHAVNGAAADDTLKAARHKPSLLDQTCKDATKAANA